MKEISRNLVPTGSTLKTVMKTLNKGVFGAVLIVDDQGKMVGLYTDGDVRRALLKGGDLDDPVESHMERNFITGSIHKSRTDNIKLLKENIRHLPILDDKGCPVDLISWAEMWRIPVMEPSLGGNELKYVSDCITSNWISSQGEYVKSFERSFSEYMDVEYSLTTSSGTTALHLSLVSMGIGPGDEVIVPDLTFAASANTVIHTGAKPVFVDVDKYTWTIDPKNIEEKLTKNTRAIMPVHLYGHPCDMDPIMEIAATHELFIVEDCAEALGAKYKGELVGVFGDIACFSFFSNKTITTGEGGMVITKSPDLYEKLLIWRDHGMSKARRYWHVVPGYNYRMTNLQAAVGLAQLEQIDTFLEQRQFVSRKYEAGLKDMLEITLPHEMEWAQNTYWLYTILLNKGSANIDRDDLILCLENEGIESRPIFYPLHMQPIYNCSGKEYPIAEEISGRGISLPSSNSLKKEEIQKVCQKLKKIFTKGY